MKHFIKYIVYFLSFLSFSEVSGQSTTDNNVPVAGKYLGYNGPGDLDLRTNNINRMRLMKTGNTTISG
ncbi:hypothetical protein O3Q51_09490 [Cryomorphaceae bacterium 1068]|nr:hypothetical protein [Cryomorphaceae bacterium 1068]